MNFKQIFGVIGVIVSLAVSADASVLKLADPGILPQGWATLSYNYSDPTLGAEREVKLNLGLGNNFQVGDKHSIDPNSDKLEARYAISNGANSLLPLGESTVVSLGFQDYNVTSRGFNPVYFLEGTYGRGNTTWLLGGVKQTNTYNDVLGLSYKLTKNVKVFGKFVSGYKNDTYVGAKLSLSPTLSVSPEVFASNRDYSKVYGYVSTAFTFYN